MNVDELFTLKKKNLVHTVEKLFCSFEVSELE